MNKKKQKPDEQGYSVIVERVNPHEIVDMVVSKSEFEVLCKSELHETVDNSIIKAKENNNGN